MITLKAHAKINLGLHVTARRPDGYHELDTLFVRLALHDTVTLRPTARGIALQVSGAPLSNGPDNLAYRAAARYLAALSRPAGVHIQLSKRIPVAAGLGGGSSDAAAVLLGLAELYPAALPLATIADALGSDVPFFTSNYPAARGRGRGERLAPLELPRFHLVLVNPGIPVSAAEAYASLKALDGPLPLDAILTALAAGTPPPLHNSLQAGIIARYPVIGQALAALQAQGLASLMSGSGASCFGLAPSAERAAQVARALQAAHPQWWVCATHSC